MALTDKAHSLLKQIYAYPYHHSRQKSREALAQEDPDEALEYVLQEIVEHLYPERWNRYRQSSPIDSVMRSAVGHLNLDRQERHTAKTS